MIALWKRWTKKENKAGLARRIRNGSAQVETKNYYMCDLTGFQSTPLINKGWSIAGNLQVWNFRIKNQSASIKTAVQSIRLSRLQAGAKGGED